MAIVVRQNQRISVDGKFFSAGGEKFFVKGLTYGPLAPDSAGLHFASPEQTEKDFVRVVEAQANLLRVYHVPPRWFLDLAQEKGLRILVDIPWNPRVCLDSIERKEEACETVRRAVYACARHPAILGFSVANEIPPDIVRWSGAQAIESFIDDLVRAAKGVDPECLCTYTNFPSTEFLQPQGIDFVCFNVYLHRQPAFKKYLARLQTLAESKPLILGEIGIDSIREGEAGQATMLRWQIEEAFRGGLAGTVVFSFTDEWFQNGRFVEDWAFGITSRDRAPKPAFHEIARQYGAAPCFPAARQPKVSVVVAAYNAARTLGACLESLGKINYPDFEVILIDDGSSDDTPQLVKKYPAVKYIRHRVNLGLSVARNTGIEASQGEIIAFTDADCRVDRDWLRYLVADLVDSDWGGIGGPNLPPPEDSPVASAVMVSPGGPAHVMLTDRLAEHIPGCNMAFYKAALVEIGMFDPIFKAAGDDVDICWRLQQAGYTIGFSPAAVVWHYRRSTVPAYLRQQRGYGHAEALLVQKHPEYFNALGAGVWRGRIYGPGQHGLRLSRSVVYHGPFGSAGFQSIYSGGMESWLLFCTTLEFHALVTAPLWILSLTFTPLLPVAVTSLLLSAIVCAAAAIQARIPVQKQRWWSRPLIGLMFFLQPIVRGWARYRGRFLPRKTDVQTRASLQSLALQQSSRSLHEVAYASTRWVQRTDLIAALANRLEQDGWAMKPDLGWSEHDIEIYGTRWANVRLISAIEQFPKDVQIVRVRLEPRWSIQSRTAFWSLCALDFLVIGLFAGNTAWLWLVLLNLPLFGFFVASKTRALQSLVTVFLDKFAEVEGLAKIQPETPEKAEAAAPPKPSIFSAPEGKEEGQSASNEINLRQP